MGDGKQKKSSPGSEAVGAYLKLLREAAEITAAEIAASSGIDPSQLWRIERGKSDPKASTMFKLVSLVGGEYHDVALLIDNPAATAEDGENLAKLRRAKVK